MTDSYNQTDINLGPAGGGGASNVIAVPWTSIAGASPTGPVYFVQLGIPVDLFGNAAADWLVAPGTPGASSDALLSATRQSPMWRLDAFFQQGPSVARPRAFLSAFYDGVGVRGGAISFIQNNWRAYGGYTWGGLASGIELSFTISWNGNTPLTLNSGTVVLSST